MSAFVSRCRAAASPLQLSVYWRLALVLFFVAFYFFTDIYMTAIIASTCHHGNDTSNGTLLPIVESNQSRPEDGKAKRTADDPVCVWTELLPYGQTSFMVGMLLGSLVGGTISDRYGKRPTLLVSVYLCTVSGLVPALLPQPIVFLVIRCLLGVVSSCIISCSFSLAVEWTPASARLWPPAFLPCCFSMGMMVSALLAWLSPTVRWLHLSLGLPQVVCLPLYISIPESPSWLLVKQRKQVLERYCGNSTEDKHHLDQLLDSARSDMQKAESHRDHTLSNLALFRHPTILLRLLVMSYISTVTALTYYGICLNIDLFGVNVYAAQFFSGLTEIPCLLVPLIRLGRRPIATLTLFLSGASCFLSLLLSRWNAPPTLVMSLALLGKLCILASVFIFILYGIELFPTVVRGACPSSTCVSGSAL
ncbi:si:dkey-190l8.2 isoform X2 [Antennarius striatus]|uniref:si:dkey-190l8.2 isoform X2 n=1 Tax=Antennarius striatus TaxID=241820 RepID=UPI0035ADA5E0